MSKSQRYFSLQTQSQFSRMVLSRSKTQSRDWLSQWKAPEASCANAPHRPHSDPSSHLHQRWFSSLHLLIMIQALKLTTSLPTMPPRRNARRRTTSQTLTLQNHSTGTGQSACALIARQPRRHSGGKVHVGLKRCAMPVESGSGQAVFFRSTVHRPAPPSSQACIPILTGRS